MEVVAFVLIGLLATYSLSRLADLFSFQNKSELVMTYCASEVDWPAAYPKISRAGTRYGVGSHTAFK